MEKSEKEQSQRYENHKILEYVERFKKDSGDEEAFAEIIKALHSFLQHLALKKFFYVAGHSSEDIYQEGLYALSTKAIPDYDIEKGPFLSFAKLCIRRHIIRC
jgi:DNA-directed RNA polymerase specialized sigma subunit